MRHALQCMRLRLNSWRHYPCRVIITWLLAIVQDVWGSAIHCVALPAYTCSVRCLTVGPCW